MCEYCEQPIGEAIICSKGISVWIENHYSTGKENHYPTGKELNASYDIGGYDDLAYCKINFCPMCGRKLLEINDALSPQI